MFSLSIFRIFVWDVHPYNHFVVVNIFCHHGDELLINAGTFRLIKLQAIFVISWRKQNHVNRQMYWKPAWKKSSHKDRIKQHLRSPCYYLTGDITLFPLLHSKLTQYSFKLASSILVQYSPLDLFNCIYLLFSIIDGSNFQDF